jgi:hypothetical protein
MPERWPGMTGGPALVRISASAGRDERCLQQQAAKAWPAMWLAQRSGARKPRLEEFPLAPVMTALDAVELRGQPDTQAVALLARAGQPLHPGVLRWGRNVLTVYLDYRDPLKFPLVLHLVELAHEYALPYDDQTQARTEPDAGANKFLTSRDDGDPE